MDTPQLIDKLHFLAERCTDGARGYSVAANTVLDTDLRIWLLAKAAQRKAFVEELNLEAVGLGGETERSGTFLGNLHREWLTFRNGVVSDTPEEVLEECIRGEEHAAADYRRVLHRLAKDGATFALVQRLRAHHQAIEESRAELAVREEVLG